MSESVPLCRLKRGDIARVTALPKTTGSFRKLAVLGVLPGTEVQVLQTVPCFILQAGYTRLAIDREMAAAVTVTTAG